MNLELVHEPFLPAFLFLLSSLVLLKGLTFWEALDGGGGALNELDGPRVGKSFIIARFCFAEEAVGLASRYGHRVQM